MKSPTPRTIESVGGSAEPVPDAALRDSSTSGTGEGRNQQAFTLVFEGDIRRFSFNPFKTETPFGRCSASGVGDAFEEIAWLRKRIDQIAGFTFDRGTRDALRELSTAFPPRVARPNRKSR